MAQFATEIFNGTRHNSTMNFMWLPQHTLWALSTVCVCDRLSAKCLLDSRLMMNSNVNILILFDYLLSLPGISSNMYLLKKPYGNSIWNAILRKHHKWKVDYDYDDDPIEDDTHMNIYVYIECCCLWQFTKSVWTFVHLWCGHRIVWNASQRRNRKKNKTTKLPHKRNQNCKQTWEREREPEKEKFLSNWKQEFSCLWKLLKRWNRL